MTGKKYNNPQFAILRWLSREQIYVLLFRVGKAQHI
jgi:hypothetical protein